MFTRGLMAILSATALLAITSMAALASTDSLAGEPTLTSDKPVGYYIWHNESGWHLRTHGPGDQHHFTATLRSNGEFRDVDSVRTESRDDVAVLDGGHTLRLDFRTYDWTDGVNFRVRGGTWLRFALRLDGELIGTEEIYLGSMEQHPENNPFIVHRPLIDLPGAGR
jgi:hypothetical protein